MPLYTSSSNMKTLPAAMGKSLILGALMVCLVLGGWEFFWRFQGFLPSIEDDINIWHLQRASISENTKIVLLGSSRAQLGLNPDLFETGLGVVPINLYVDGNPPFAVLKDLAEDEEFKGLVICSVLPRWLAEKSPRKDRAAKWVRKYKKRGRLSHMDTWISMMLQKTFVFRYPGLSPKKIKKQFEKGLWPEPSYAPMRSDRYREAVFTQKNTSKIRGARIRREQEIAQSSILVSDVQFEKRIAAVNLNVKKIRKRGGKVVFVRMPSSGEIRKIEARTWPRIVFWDRFAQKSAAPVIHFEDYSELNGFKCPDGSHLGGDDAKEFTRRLLKLLPFKEKSTE